MNNCISELSVLSDVPERILVKLADLMKQTIVDGIDDANIMHENIADFDIGIGTISICLEKEIIKYKFIPSKELDSSIKIKIKTGNNPLEVKLEESLVNRIKTTYKDLL